MALCAVLWGKGVVGGTGFEGQPSTFKFDEFHVKVSNIVLLGRSEPPDLSLKGLGQIFSSLSKYNAHLPMATSKELK